MTITAVANLGIGQFCVTLCDDPIYRERVAERIADGRAEHLLRYYLDEELKPPRKKGPQQLRARRYVRVYIDHDRDPNLQPVIRSPRDQEQWDAYVRSRDQRLADAAKRADGVIAVARSRFPLLDQVVELGPARERFVRRWRAGKVSKGLEIRIHEIAAAMDDVECNRPKEFLTILHGRFEDPMARNRALESPSQSPTPRPLAKPPAPQAAAPRTDVSGRNGPTADDEVDIGDGPPPPVYHPLPRPRRYRTWMGR